jgi:hypothetical protein
VPKPGNLLAAAEERLENNVTQFAHVILFCCPNCSRPLASACASERRNLEVADAHFFNPHCHCGWSGPVAGLEGVRHWVEPWVLPIQTDAGESGSCNGQRLG